MRNILYKIIREEDKHLLNQKGVYQIKNLENNKVYIGSTSIKFSNRLTSHIRGLVKNRHHSIHLQNSFNKERKFEKFEVSILEICSTDQCLEVEQKWIDFYQSHNQQFGYNISPTAGSCFGIKKSKEEKIKVFERSRKLTDEQIIEIFHFRNYMKLDNKEISKRIGVSNNQISSILTRPEKYQYVKEKYNLKLEIKHEKKFTKEDVKAIHEFYENQKLSIREISEINGFEFIPLKHLIYKENLYRLEKEGLKFNIEKNRKSKIYKKIRRRGYKINKEIIDREIIFSVFNLKYNLNLNNQEISEILQISLKEINLITTFRYQRRKYNQLYISLKTNFHLREKRTLLSEEDIVGIFNDYNSGKYLIEELNEKYNFNDVGLIIQKSDRISDFYKDIINKNNLEVDKSSTKNKEIKSKSMSEMNKKRAKNYKLINPDGNEIIVKNLADFCKDKNLDAANLSRVSKNGKLYKGWKCICLD
jgi:group I intron endonuclease